MLLIRGSLNQRACFGSDWATISSHEHQVKRVRKAAVATKLRPPEAGFTRVVGTLDDKLSTQSSKAKRESSSCGKSIARRSLATESV